jgi:hypothetical protein
VGVKKLAQQLGWLLVLVVLVTVSVPYLLHWLDAHWSALVAPASEPTAPHPPPTTPALHAHAPSFEPRTSITTPDSPARTPGAASGSPSLGWILLGLGYLVLLGLYVRRHLAARLKGAGRAREDARAQDRMRERVGPSSSELPT